MNDTRKTRLLIVASAIAIVVAGVLAAHVTLFSQASQPEFIQGKAQPAAHLELPGAVEASEEAKLFSRIAGIAQKVHVALGDRVKKGQLLAELFVPELEAEQKQKAAVIAQSEAEIELARRALQLTEAAVRLPLTSTKPRRRSRERKQITNAGKPSTSASKSCSKAK